jgi:hypothetical protein
MTNDLIIFFPLTSNLSPSPELADFLTPNWYLNLTHDPGLFVISSQEDLCWQILLEMDLIIVQSFHTH